MHALLVVWKCCIFFFCGQHFFVLTCRYLRLSVSVFSAELNIKKAPLKPHMQKLPTTFRVVSPLFMQKLPGEFWYLALVLMGTSLFLPCLLLLLLCSWADMMPSHSMDLPVPRGTSMVLQAGKVRHVVKLVLWIVSMFLMWDFVSALVVSITSAHTNTLWSLSWICLRKIKYAINVKLTWFASP